MQNAKDSFYIALRNRLAVLNPARSLEIRAIPRPGILVEEAEAPMAESLPDVFMLRWSAVETMENLPAPLCSLSCEMLYATSGSQVNGGLDRGRAMAAMDRELLHILRPMYTPKLCYTSTPAIAMQTNLFWTEPLLGALAVERNLLSRVAKVTVFAFEEPGEL